MIIHYEYDYDSRQRYRSEKGPVAFNQVYDSKIQLPVHVLLEAKSTAYKVVDKVYGLSYLSFS